MYLKNYVLISACLMGFNCRYNGKNCLSKYIDVYLKNFNLIPVCPEQLGGLPTPREKSEINHGDGFYVIKGKSRVINHSGTDVTENFLKGANEILNFVRMYGIKKAYFKDKSPSCGVTKVYNKKNLINGVGVTTALLIENNVEVFGVDL